MVDGKIPIEIHVFDFDLPERGQPKFFFPAHLAPVSSISLVKFMLVLTNFQFQLLPQQSMRYHLTAKLGKASTF